MPTTCVSRCRRPTFDREFGARQDAFRRRVRDSGLVTGSFASPAGLGQLVERSLRDLAQTRHGGRGRRLAGRVQAVVVGDIPQEPAGFQPRADLLAELDAQSPGRGRVSVVHAWTGMRGVGKTQLAAAYARARIDEEWRLVAWVNAEDAATVLGGLVAVAAALGLYDSTGDAEAAGRAVRRRLEAAGDRCLLVFDNAADPADLLPFLPWAGKARVLVTSNERAVALERGAGVAVDVFTEAEALAFLAEAERLAGRRRCPAAGGGSGLGCRWRWRRPRRCRRPAPGLPHVPATAAGHTRWTSCCCGSRPSEYPHGLAAAVLLSLQAARVERWDRGQRLGDGRGVGAVGGRGAPGGAARGRAGRGAGRKGKRMRRKRIPSAVVDEAVGRLAGSSLLTFSVDGGNGDRAPAGDAGDPERLARQGRLAATYQAAAAALQARAESLEQAWAGTVRPAGTWLSRSWPCTGHAASCSGERMAAS